MGSKHAAYFNLSEHNLYLFAGIKETSEGGTWTVQSYPEVYGE